MINLFIVRKYAALLVACFLPVVFFFVSITFYGMWVAIVFLFIAVGLSLLLGNIFLKTPFNQMLEGKGILALDITSTGIITPFIVKVQEEFIEGFVNKGHRVKDIFDREAVYNMKPPVDAVNKVNLSKNEDKKSFFKLELTEDDYNKSKFQLYHYPVLIYNSQVSSVLTKDILAGDEKNIFAEHNIIYLRKVLQELGRDIKNFGRYIVDSIKPTTNILTNPIVVVIMIIVLIILAIIFIPKIFATLGISLKPMAAGGGASGGSIITPN